MIDLLKQIYLDYYDLENTLEFDFDKEFMEFIVYISKNETENTLEMIKKFKNQQNKKVIKELQTDNIKKDMFFIEKKYIHITYPIENTLQRLEIIYSSIGKKKWDQKFGFDFELFKNVICYILFRVIMYNNYYSLFKEKKYQYEAKSSISTKFYFTKEELYACFPKHKTEIDKILKIITKKISELKNIQDTFYILKYNNKYILYFIWDFIYNLFDIIEIYILKTEKNKNQYYNNRGKIFEKYCYKEIKKLFKKNIYTNLEYKDQKGNNHEIDILVETENEYLIFECKSGKFNINTTIDNIDMKKNFIKTFGRGYKTLNDFDKYVNNDEILKIYDKSTKKEYKFDFKNKKLIYLNISLHNIDYLQTNIQKIDKKLITPVKVYPINLNYIDFSTIFELGSRNYSLFMKYIYRRFKMINTKKEITLDIDEIDAFGFLTDEENENVYNMMVEGNNKANIELTIENAAYRNQINDWFNERFFHKIINRYIRK